MATNLLKKTTAGVCALAAAALVQTAGPAGSAETPETPETPCPKVQDVETTCDVIRVPLDRANPAKGTTPVRYLLARLPGRRGAGTVALNDGGPGSATIAGLAQQPEMLPQVFGKILVSHDMLLMDPRGSGGSGALHCRDLTIENIPGTRSGLLDAAAACGRELGARSRYYTSAATADDLDAVRARLGIRRLDLLGESYGTYLMTVYAQRHPGRVRSAVLSSAYPLGFDMWARPNARAMRRAIDALCERSAGRCKAGTVLADLGALASRLRARPLPYEGYGGTRALDGTALAALTYEASGDRELMGRLPGIVRAALRGDSKPLIEVARAQRPPLLSDRWPATDSMAGSRARPRTAPEHEPQSLPLWASVMCNDYPTLWDRRAPIAERTRQFERARDRLYPGTFAPFGARAWTGGIYDRGNFCLRWPDRNGPLQPTSRPLPGVPVLVLSGELDANTPTEEGRAAAGRYPRARVIEVPNTGHVAEMNEAANPCVMGLQSEFFRTGRVTDTGCLAEIPPISVP